MPLRGSRHAKPIGVRYHALAADYDGTLAHHGLIDDLTWASLRRLRDSGRKLIMVFLDSAGKYSRLGDAERVRRWLEESGAPTLQQPAATPRVTS